MYLEKYYKDLPHGSTLLECRSGGDKQTIMPGSIIEGEEVKWKIFEELTTKKLYYIGPNPTADTIVTRERDGVKQVLLVQLIIKRIY